MTLRCTESQASRISSNFALEAAWLRKMKVVAPQNVADVARQVVEQMLVHASSWALSA